MTRRHYWQGGLSRTMALVLVVLVAEVSVVAASASAQVEGVAPPTLVSNHGQIDPDGLLTRGGTVFQGFTTGGSPGGYELSDVSVVLLVPPPDPPDTEDVHELSGLRSKAALEQAAPDFTIEIWSEKGINIKMPDELLYTLITPPSVPLGEAVAFTAPPDTVLDPNTSYYVKIIGATQVAWDMDREVDAGAAEGWSLHTGLMYQSVGANTYITYVPNAIIAVRGTAL